MLLLIKKNSIYVK